MNRGTYRLIFNAARGTWMAVMEWARGHGKRASRRTQRRSANALSVAGLAAFLVAGPALARTPRAPLANPLPVPAVNFVERGAVAAPSVDGTRMAIRQESAKAVLNWNSFDIESGYRVTFSHPNAAAATLNKIGGNDPSVIRGMLESVARDTGGTGGAIYLVNRNGILFAEGAQVNVGALTASALDIASDVFESGLLSAKQGTESSKADPVFTWGGDDAQRALSLVKVETGAQIATSQEGRVMLLAPRVENAGSINTPQGQTILAAGDKVYLAAPASGSKLRGFLVEVDPGATPGVATNLGNIVAERGNITIAALAVNQRGRLSATTTVDMNGSIYLQARDTVAPGYLETAADGASVYNPLATRMGTLTFGAGSVTEVMPETSNARTLRDDQNFNKSEIVGSGKTIVLEGAGGGVEGSLPGARIAAPAGEVRLTAQGNLSGNTDVFNSAPDPAARIYVGQGTSVDVAGLRDIALSVERNIIEAELRGNELKDSPLQRSGALAGQKVLIDIRKGTPLADVSGYIAGVQRGIAEKSATGGNVVLKSEGDVIVRQGSTIDVSGGSLDYAGGDTGTSRLVSNGRSYDISTASNLLTYSGVVKDTYRYEQGYTEGKNAGKLAIDANQVVLDGTLRGGTVAGIHQRTASARPTGGQLVLNGLGSAVRFVNGEAALAAAFGAGDPLAGTPLLLDSSIFNSNGFSRLNLSTSGNVSLPSHVAIVAAPGGELDISARSIDVQGVLSSAGGEITLGTRALNATAPAEVAIKVGKKARISTSGMLVNDQRPGAGAGPVVPDGGKLKLDSAGDLSLAAGSVLDVSGGAWLQADGKTRFGNAGTLSLSSGTLTRSAQSDAKLELAGATLAGYGISDGLTTGKGGTLAITASNVSIGGMALGRSGELHLDESFFRSGGFASHAITARDQLSVAPGTRVKAEPRSLLLRRSREGSLAETILAPQMLPDFLRNPGSLALATLSRSYGDLTVGRNAYLGVDPGGSIELKSERSIHVDGTLEAPGGRIDLIQPKADPKKDEYLADRAIWLGANSRLLAQGYARLRQNAAGRRVGTVNDGGSVTIDAAKGYLVTQTIETTDPVTGDAISQRALIDVSGTTATLDLLENRSGAGGSAVGSNGGKVTLAAREGMLLDGDMKATGGKDSLGGSFNLAFENGNAEWNRSDNPNLSEKLESQLRSPRRVVLANSHPAVTAGMSFGDDIDPSKYNGVAMISAGKLKDAGFDDVTIKSENRIEFQGTVSLETRRAITLDAPNLAAHAAAEVTLASSLVMLGNTHVDRQGAAYRDDASGGTGSLKATADHIVLAGSLTQQGFGTTTLNSRGDIEGRAVAAGSEYLGTFISGGSIGLYADRIYPSSLSDFSVEIHNNPKGSIATGYFDKQDGDDGAVLSAGGRLALAAPVVTHGGALKAPFGTIELRSENIVRVGDTETRTARPKLSKKLEDGSETQIETVSLADGSVTSVAGEGQLIPFGKTELSGSDWIYSLGAQTSRFISMAPEKRVLLDGDIVKKSIGAKVDLSGGGDLLAWEFLPGTGGSKDVLDAGVSPTTYAILPTQRKGYAPYDLQSWSGTSLTLGQNIELIDSVGTLAAGSYVLLPARYALLPGAYTVTFTGQSDVSAGRPTALAGGGWQVAAYRTSSIAANVQRAAVNEYVQVIPGDVSRTRSEYLETRASEFFSGKGGRLPGDAGSLAVRSGSKMTLGGGLETAHASGHRGAELDIVANRLVVRGNQPAQADYTGFVTLDAASLNSLGAESIVLGAIRAHKPQGTTLDVGTSELIVDNRGDSAGTALAAPDLILAAAERVSLAKNSTIVAGGGKAADDLIVAGDGALLRVSGNGLGQLTRTGNPAGIKGSLKVEEGGTVTGAAVTLDATKDSSFSGQFGKTVSGEESVKALALGANRISLGDVPAGTNGLALDDSRIAALDKIETLRLKSYSTVDLYGATSFGTGLKTLEIQAAGIAGRDNAGKTATLAATNLALSNPDGIAFDAAKPAGTGSGALALTATDTLTLGQGDFKVDGFATSTLTARQIVATGTGSHAYAGDLTMNAGRVTASSDARQKIAAAGKLVTQAVAQATPFSGADFGGQLALSGVTLEHGGRIDLSAGKLILQATAGDLELLAGSEVNATGAGKTFADKTLFVSGGAVILESHGGNVNVKKEVKTTDGNTIDAAKIDVSGASAGGDGGDAGRLEVRAADGTATLAGTLKGQKGSSTAAGGEFLLDAGSVADLSALAGKLGASGFSESVDVRARGGGMALNSGTTLKAHEVKLATDNGNLTIAGTIDASGAKGGSIELWANRGATANTGKLTLADGANLKATATEILAKASGSRGEGGDVTLGVSASSAAHAEEARLLMLAGSSIDVSAATGSAAGGGKVLLRAPRVGGNEIAITGNADGSLAHQPGTKSAMIGTTITGASSVAAEAVRIHETTGNLSINTAQQTAWKTDTAAFMANAAAIKVRLGLSDAFARVHAGIEARATGDITLSNDWNLYGWRDGGVPGALTLRANGDVKVGASLSDGFSSLTANTVGSGESWSYRIVAGAADNAANPLELAAPAALGDKGNLTLAANKLVRTGTGSIDIAAGGKITGEANAVVYTAGTAGATIPTAEFAAIHNINNPSFPTRGGDLSLAAQGDIKFQRNSDHIVVDWLWRQGRLQADGTLGNTSNGSANNTAWWINFPQFKDGVATLGGGDVRVKAGGMIEGLSVSAPTNARLKGKNILPSAENLVLQGGGDVNVIAASNIVNGKFYAAAGTMDITAGEAFGTDGAANIIALGDSVVRVKAGSGVRVDKIVDPFLMEQAIGNTTGSTIQTGYNDKRLTYFSNYSAASRVDLTALNGRMALVEYQTLLPPTLNLAALGGSLKLGGQEMHIAPSPIGNLGMYAADTISIGHSISLSDVPVYALVSPLSPKSSGKADEASTAVTATHRHSNPPLHGGDSEPVRIVALHGDIVGLTDNVNSYFPKRALISAGGDIVDFGIVGQNLATTDITRVVAGGDIMFKPSLNSEGQLSNTNKGIQIGGPGRIEIIAGGDIDLSNSQGIVTRGNFNNPYLADSGASVMVQAGAAAADYAGFLAWLEEPAQAETRALAGYTSLGSNTARAAFLAQADSGQKLNDVFYTILRGVGRAAATSGSQEYAAGYDAIAALFPEKNGPYGGDIKMYFSQIKTEQGGGIDLLAPGGMVNAGLAAGDDTGKSASQLGIITARGGSVRAMVRDDFAVNQSRVFTLQGGDILIWSSEGDIDAGKGAKTAASTPPPQIIVRGDRIILDTSNSVSGSGIGVLLGKDGIEEGSVDLIAPKGAVIAGDAGIRALGNIYLAASQVKGADNIQAGGKQVGVPQVEAAAAPPPPPPPAAEAAKAAEQATAAASDSTRGSGVSSSILTVEILALGEEEDDKKRR